METTPEAREPERTCVGCRRRRPQSELWRCALDASGRAVVARTAPGRGAWVCGADCAEIAMRRKAFDRAWRRSVEASALHGLVEELRSCEHERPGMRD